MNRDLPKNCQVEPPYPDHPTAVFSIRYPDFVAHSSSARCPEEYPHPISECGEFVCPTCQGARTIEAVPAGAGHEDDLAEHVPCPDCAR